MKEEIIIVGSGGHAKSCIDLIENLNKYNISKIYDPLSSKKKLFDYEIIKDEKQLIKLFNKVNNIFIGIGYIKNINIRLKYINFFEKYDLNYPNILSNHSYISIKSKIGHGNSFHHNTIINSDTSLGNFNIINTGSILEHGVKIGNNCHVSTNVVINGDVQIGNNTFIGSGSVIKQGIKISNDKLIPMGTLVFKNIL